MMTAPLATTCPACKAVIGDDERVCPACGAAIGTPLPAAAARPLILPGTSGLSADTVRARPPIAKIALGTLVVAGIIGVVVARMPEPAGDPSASFSARVARDPDAPSAAIDVTGDSAASASDTAARTVDTALRVASADTGVADSAAAFSAGATRAADAPAAVPAAPVSPPVAAPVSAAPVTPEARAERPRDVAVERGAAVLLMSAPDASELRPGERLQLRWTARYRSGGRAPDVSVRFSSTDASVASVNARTGSVTARTPGRVRIIADAGDAGIRTVALRVVAPQPVARVATTPVPRATAGAAASVPSVALPTVSLPPISTEPVRTTSAPPPAPAAVRESPAPPLPDLADVRAIATRFVNDVRSGANRNADLAAFLSDGDDHRVTLAADPVISSVGISTIRASFMLRLTRFDAAGRPVTRIAPVSMIVDKRNNVLNTSAVDIGPLRRP